jgi:hypothetical protein
LDVVDISEIDDVAQHANVTDDHEGLALDWAAIDVDLARCAEATVVHLGVVLVLDRIVVHVDVGEVDDVARGVEPRQPWPRSSDGRAE